MDGLSTRKVSGHYTSMGLWGELEEGATLSCVHCQRSSILKKGSGKAWFWCGDCAGYHCDEEECRVCVGPWEARCENIEAGRPILTPRPPMILVPSLPGN